MALLLLLLPLLGGCHESSSPTEPLGPTKASLSGVVIDDTTKAPVTGGQVNLWKGEGNTPVASSAIAADGSYSLAGLEPGFYGVDLRPADRPATSGGTLQLLAGDNRHDFHLAPADCLAPYGTVRDASTGRPIAGAQVLIWWKTATTDADGRYRIDFGCEPHLGSSASIEVRRDGYQTYSTTTRVSYLCNCVYDFALQPQ